MNRVPVLAPDGTPLMPTTSSRCRRWLRDGKASIVPNNLNVFCIQLVAEPCGRSTQDVVVGIDPGKLFSGVGVQSSKFTLFMAHLVLPFKSVTQKMTARRILRRARRGRRINRKLPYRTHLTSFLVILGFEASRHSRAYDTGCSVESVFARGRRKPASCKAFVFRIRSQMGSITSVLTGRRDS